MWSSGPMQLTSRQAMATSLLLGALAALLSVVQMRSQFLRSETVQPPSRMSVPHKGARSIGPHSTVVRSPGTPVTFPLTPVVPSTESLLQGALPMQTKASPMDPLISLAAAVVGLAASLAWFSWRPGAPEMALIAMAAEQPSRPNPAQDETKNESQKHGKAAKDAKTAGSVSAGDVPMEDVSAEDPIKAIANDIKKVEENIKAVEENIKAVEENIKAVEENIKAVEENIKAVENDIRKIGEKIASYESVVIRNAKGQPINTEEFPELLLCLNEKGQVDTHKVMDKRKQLIDEKKQLRDKENKLIDKEKQLRDEKNKLIDQQNKLIDEKKQLRDKENKSMDEKIQLAGKQDPQEPKECQDYMEEMLKAEVKNKRLTISKVYTKENDIDQLTAFEKKPVQLVVRDFYQSLSEEILSEISESNVYYVYMSGTPGTGKTMFRNYMVWYLLKKFKGARKALRIVMAKGGSSRADLLCLEASGTYRTLRYQSIDSLSADIAGEGWVKGHNLFCLADLSQGKKSGIGLFHKCAIVFTSPNLKAWDEEEKEKFRIFWMPLWTEAELGYIGCDEKENEVKERFIKYGGVPRLVWGSEKEIEHQERRLCAKPTLESLTVHGGGSYFLPSSVQHRFIYLDVHKKDEKDGGGYDFIQLPSPIVGTRHLADIMADHYIRDCLGALSADFPPKMGGQLQGDIFESTVLKLLSEYSGNCAFYIKDLKGGSGKIWVKKYLATDPQDNGFWYSRPPQNKRVNFDGDKDAVETVKKNLAEYKAILAIPRSFQLSGFDAILAWVGALDPKASGDVGTNESPQLSSTTKGTSNNSASPSPGSSLNNEPKYALLLQVTIRKNHPMSAAGVELIHQFTSQGFNVAIVYIVPEKNSSAFGKQKLEGEIPNDDTFEKTSQWCMYLGPGQPQGRHRSSKGKKVAKIEQE